MVYTPCASSYDVTVTRQVPRGLISVWPIGLSKLRSFAFILAEEGLRAIAFGYHHRRYRYGKHTSQKPIPCLHLSKTTDGL